MGHVRRAIIFVVICFVLFGLAYPLAGTGVAQLFFKHQADGSITANGSTLIGQNWESTRWFHGRPDDFGPYHATAKTKQQADVSGDNPYEANGVLGESGATNYGPRSKTLVQYTRELVVWWHAHGVQPTSDLVTTSGSGYDPDISPQDAYVQIPMVSQATGISPARLRSLIASQVQGAQLGFLGAPYIVVLNLNEALAKLEG
ncbi:MAG TPA: potassium-transporting ATPase subunit C [Acidimicrobiales bacterium]|nr:potassium-transporting ATPase subunit C [Acidimicrobiales bacterium]